jgi:hypothetical protein
MAAEESKNQIQKEDQYDFLVYEYHTWGSYGQHIKTFKFLIDVEEKTQKPLWEIVNVKWEVNDSRKNKHRKAYASLTDIRKMRGKIIKEITDYQSSSRREIRTKYYLVDNNGLLQELNAETNIKVNGKYYDILEIDGKRIMVNKDEVLVQ